MASAVYEGEVAFISGVAENGTVVGNSYWTMHPRIDGNTNQSLATKWGSGTPGTGADVTYSFAAASNWTASEKAAWEGGLALWSAVADIKFIAAADAASANFVIIRGDDGAFARYVAPGPERRRRQHPRRPKSNRLDHLRSTPTPWVLGRSARTSRRAVAIRC